MPLRDDIEKVLVIGSGPIIIGQAAEFDYSGTQACKALKEEGIEVVLINSNPATIMTDRDIADSVYIEPLTVDYAREIISKEQPDGLLPTLGGQTGLNLAVELSEAGVLEEQEVELLGTDLKAITGAEDRELFRNLMKEIGEPVVDSIIAESYQQALNFAREAGFPVIVRPAYTMGGSGGGMAENREQLESIVELGIKRSRINQVLIEKSIAGWKELEYEVIRDAAGNCITVCNMENIDPVGIHTGDSIVVAPSQTLTDKEYQLLRSVSIKIISELDIEGGCNIQFALDPESGDYYIIEVNPRVSRSSALASKATGYPIARVSAKIALGLHLDEIENSVTDNTYACFEPALDYIVTKIPRWPFDKFAGGDRQLGSQMKATGEVMAIGRNLKESFLKAVDSLDFDIPALFEIGDKEKLLEKIAKSRDDRVFLILRALYSGISIEEIHEITGMNYFYLNKFNQIVELAHRLEANFSPGLLLEAKEVGFSDHLISLITAIEEQEIRSMREKTGRARAYKMVDTCAAEFAAVTPYYYSTYDREDEVEVSSRDKVLVVGAGPIRIGQGIEFDYSSVHAVRALQKNGVEAIIVNNNPETVSTDFDTGDKLYFEPLTFEYIYSIIEAEGVEDVILQFGGQTAINLAAPLTEAGVNVLGTDLESINLVEDRRQFNQINELNEIPTPPGFTVFSLEEALEKIEEIGFPALVRPSYVLGGRGMEIVYNLQQLKKYLQEAVKLSPRHPVLIDRYIVGKEVEVDAIADGEQVLIPGIMEHIERAGVHSGDSMAVYPARNLTREDQDRLLDFTRRIVKVMNIRGLVNIQFVIDEVGKIYVLEVNPRASRTIPILSKVTSVPMVEYAVKVMLGNSLTEISDRVGLLPPSQLTSVKVPVFSFDKMMGIDIHLNPEMKSTGEVLGTATSYEKAVYKGLLGARFQLPEAGNILFSLADRDKEAALPLAEKLSGLGFNILASGNTVRYLQKNGVSTREIDDYRQLIRRGEVDMVINSPTRGKDPSREGFQLRRMAVEYNLPVYTSLDTVRAVIKVLSNNRREEAEVYSLSDYYKQR